VSVLGYADTRASLKKHSISDAATNSSYVTAALGDFGGSLLEKPKGLAGSTLRPD